MLTSIILSITFLLAILFLIVCLLGFQGALAGQRYVRSQIECLGVNVLAGDDESVTTGVHRQAA
jgi:hypothetical protein